MSDGFVLVGKKTNKVIITKEPTFKFPSLDNIVENLMRSDISDLFPNEQFCKEYLKLLIDSNRNKDDVLQALRRLYDAIWDSGEVTDEELYESVDSDEFAVILYNNFNLLNSM